MEGEEMSQLRKVRRKILLFPLPLQGHVIPMFNLANILHSKGFSIILIHTRYNSPDPTHFPHLTFHFLEDGLPQNSRLTSNDLTTVLSAIQSNCVQPLQDCLSQILSAAATDQEPVACLISDPMYSFAGSVAQSFNLPRMVLRTGGMSAFVLYDSLPMLRQNGYFPLQVAKFDEPVPELPPLKVKDLPPEVQHGILATTVKETKNSQGVICNTLEELEDYAIATVQQSIPYPIFPIGPMHKYSQTSAASILQPDHTSLSWLNTQPPKTVLYVSFGSIAVISETEFLEMAWGLANSRQPFLWVVRPGLSKDSELSEMLPVGYSQIVGERGKIVKWAPQLEVLSHPAVGGFWTHCGWNSTVESICEGVPMLCLPFFADQAINARHICDNWKIGLRLEKKTRENIESAITKLMADGDSAEMRIRITAFKEKAKLCLQKDGSSYESLERLTNYLTSL
ncbi:UDP-glycosyltransferase 76B1-like [Silene latifolia]|uniref:UDP-glycosyltransferase 76B1-like n=1 Tax=Silene latifolia TaxID=37657 RepID=UPI003D7830DD